MPTPNRSGEYGSIPERTGRFLQKEGYWYYTTREGVEIGPYDLPQDAELGVGEFINFIGESEPDIIEMLKLYRVE